MNTMLGFWSAAGASGAPKAAKAANANATLPSLDIRLSLPMPQLAIDLLDAAELPPSFGSRNGSGGPDAVLRHMSLGYEFTLRPGRHDRRPPASSRLPA